MPIRLSHTLVALAAAASGVSASAADVDWGPFATPELSVSRNTGGFSDRVDFSVAALGDVTLTAVATNLSTVLNLEDGMVAVYQELGAVDTFIGSFSFDGTTGSTWHSYLSLPAGSYYAQVSGNATGASGSLYSLAAAYAPLSGPPTTQVPVLPLAATFGGHDTLESTAAHLEAGAFTRDLTFELYTTTDITSTAVATNLSTTLNLEDGQVALYRETGAVDTLIGSYSFDGTTGSTWHSYLLLDPGAYFYRLTGTATGSSGASFTLASHVSKVGVAPIPEPQTYALMLAGLGVIAAVARRRRSG